MIGVAITQLLGFMALASTMHATPGPVRFDRRHSSVCRITGTLLLSVSAIMALRLTSAGFAIIDWLGLATLAATIVLLVLAIVRRHNRSHRHKTRRRAFGDTIARGIDRLGEQRQDVIGS